MRPIKLLAGLVAMILVPTAPALAGPASSNVVTIEVNPKTTTFPRPRINKPFVSVTICAPGQTSKGSCATIDNVLGDTGSIGLRIFGGPSRWPFALLKSGGGVAVIECQMFSDGRALWGPIVSADLIIGGEKAVNIPMQMIDAGYAGAFELGICEPGKQIQSAQDAGFNGILGLNFLTRDKLGTYYSIYGAQGAPVTDCSFNGGVLMNNNQTCVITWQNPPTQLDPSGVYDFRPVNPVTQFPVDNNGFIITMQNLRPTKPPSKTPGQSSSATRTLTFGINTKANNRVPASANFFFTEAEGGVFTAVEPDASYPALIDSGTQGWVVPPSLKPGVLFECNGVPTWYCALPPTDVQIDIPSGTVKFTIGNYLNLIETGAGAFDDIAGPIPPPGNGAVILGMPFFYGRTIYFGLGGPPGTDFYAYLP